MSTEIVLKTLPPTPMPFPTANKSKRATPSVFPTESRDLVRLQKPSPGMGMAMTADQILKAINKELGEDFAIAKGGQKLDLGEYTPEKTADRIVGGITAFYSAFRKSNPKLDDNEAISRFMAAARTGVEKGYDDAYKILSALGALTFDGVEDGIARTKELVFEKLAAFEASARPAPAQDREKVEVAQ